MPFPLCTPRVNNNDDTVRLVKVLVQPGAFVRAAQTVAEVETDKANFTVEAEQDGFVLSIAQELNTTIEVGSVLLWLGQTADEAAPVASGELSVTGNGPAAAPTLKAAQLLAKHGLSAAAVPASGDRVTVRDVELFLAQQSSAPRESREGTGPTVLSALAPGDRRPLTPEERGMMRTVLWHRDEAVPGYVELQYDATPWNAFASQFQNRERLLLGPLLALMAHRLARLAAENDALNSTIVDDERYVYRTVNLGFTIQSDGALYLAVVHDAARMTEREFVDRLAMLQRGAVAHTLRAADLTGATVSFTSMARWDVSRHIPVLPPHTSLIVAHSTPASGAATLGATYDHRVLTGLDVMSVLRNLSVPEESQ